MRSLALRAVTMRILHHFKIDRMVIVAACVLAMSIQVHYRTPSRFLFVLIPLIGIAISLLSIILLFRSFGGVSKGRAVGPTLHRIEWWGKVLVRVFVYYSLFLFANAKLDRSEPADQPSEILSISGRETAVGLPFSYSWVTLRSWKNPGGAERLLLQEAELEKLWAGESVVIQLRSGYFQLPWVSKLERNEEKYAGEVLDAMPTASQAWKNLIDFYMDHERWKEAADATHHYLKIYPNADDFAVHVAGAMNVAGYYTEAVSLLDQVMTRRPTYEVHQLLGWALSYQGNKKRAAEILEASIPLNPDDWEAYYHLGYVYTDMGKPEEAIFMFEKVLERQPNFPEVNEQIVLNRQAIANRRAFQKTM